VGRRDDQEGQLNYLMANSIALFALAKLELSVRMVGLRPTAVVEKGFAVCGVVVSIRNDLGAVYSDRSSYAIFSRVLL
jgi:hypothetical protein